jgi:hypothetical protein
MYRKFWKKEKHIMTVASSTDSLLRIALPPPSLWWGEGSDTPAPLRNGGSVAG